MSKALLLVGMLLPLQAWAAGKGIPTGTIVSQIANLGILLAILYFAGRKTVVAAFAQKKQDYLDQVSSATQAKIFAEEALQDVDKRLQNIRETYQAQVVAARQQAETEYQEQVQESRQAAKRAFSHAQETLEFEAQKQIESLRLEVFQKSSTMAEENLKKSLTPEQQKAWSARFAQSQGVH